MEAGMMMLYGNHGLGQRIGIFTIVKMRFQFFEFLSIFGILSMGFGRF
jgi:hypothetical protein